MDAASYSPDVTVLKNMLEEAKKDYPNLEVAITSPYGKTGVFYLEEIGDGFIKAKDKDSSVYLFPIAYVDYAIGLNYSQQS